MMGSSARSRRARPPARKAARCLRRSPAKIQQPHHPAAGPAQHVPGRDLGVKCGRAFPAVADRASIRLVHAGKLHLGQPVRLAVRHVVEGRQLISAGRFELLDLPGGFDAACAMDERRAVQALLGV